MSYRGRVTCFASLAIAATVFAAIVVNGSGFSRSAVAEEAAKPAGPPPLVVDTAAPLLLDTPAPATVDPFAVPTGPLADNSACYVCHTNYEEEEMVVQHAKANVGCIKCHGPSHAHRNDENNITPPDVMFPSDKIAKNCAECHDTHDAPPADVIVRWQQRCAAKANPEELLCTDCHGLHRLTIRNVRWDKSTRELIIYKKPEQTKIAPGLTKNEPEKKSADGVKASAAIQ